MICKHSANNIFNKLELIFLHSQMISSISSYINHSIHLICLHSQTVLNTAMHQQQFNVSHLPAHIQINIQDMWEISLSVILILLFKWIVCKWHLKRIEFICLHTVNGFMSYSYLLYLPDRGWQLCGLCCCPCFLYYMIFVGILMIPEHWTVHLFASVTWLLMMKRLYQIWLG